MITIFGLITNVLPCVFYRFFIKNMVENGNDVEIMGLSIKYFMVEKNGSVFYFLQWNIKKR